MLHPLHAHPLAPNFSEALWSCDGNSQPGGCKRIQLLERKDTVIFGRMFIILRKNIHWDQVED